jgi:Flp pilus assembly protein TadG
MERGSVSLELVVVFPVVLLIIFGVVQGALYYHARNVALAAAQEGARAAGAEHGTEAAGGAAAWSFLTQAGGAQVMTQLDVTPHRTATAATVTVTGRAISVLPGIPGFTVTQTADRPVERFTSSAGGTP